MARNKYFRDYSGEQNTVEDLTIEIIKMMGKDMVYIPRTILTKDDLFGEDTLSKFDDGYQLEMYIQSVDGFEGEGDILSKYGLQIKDKIELIVSKKRFEEDIMVFEGITRPREGDLIYFPLSKTLFEINFVEHENPFYSLGKLYTYKLSCEVFNYSIQDDIDTGITIIDAVEEDRKQFAIKLTLGNKLSATTDYTLGENVFQISGATGGIHSDADVTGVVVDWDPTNKVITVGNLEGTLSTGTTSDSIKGTVSTAEYELSSTSVTETVIIQQPENNTTMGDNEDIEYFADIDNIFDFTETDPFSEGNL